MCYLVHVLEARVWQHHVVEGQGKVLKKRILIYHEGQGQGKVL